MQSESIHSRRAAFVGKNDNNAGERDGKVTDCRALLMYEIICSIYSISDLKGIANEIWKSGKTNGAAGVYCHSGREGWQVIAFVSMRMFDNNISVPLFGHNTHSSWGSDWRVISDSGYCALLGVNCERFGFIGTPDRVICDIYYCHWIYCTTLRTLLRASWKFHAHLPLHSPFLEPTQLI